MNDVQTLAKKFAELKSKVDEIKNELKEVNAEWEGIEAELIQEMVNEGTNSIGIDGIGLFSLRTKNYMSVNAANHLKFYQYLRESGHGDLIKDYVNPATLTSFLKEHAAEVEKKLADEKGLDQIEARDAAIEFLKQKGAAVFSDKTIALTKR